MYCIYIVLCECVWGDSWEIWEKEREFVISVRKEREQRDEVEMNELVLKNWRKKHG